MDLSQSGDSYCYVDTNKKADDLCMRMEAADSVAIDTECDSLYHYFEKVCLLQISFAGENYLVDTLSKIKLTNILDILSRRRIIVHCGDYDFRMMKKSFGFQPRAEVFDTWLAARLLGIKKVSLTDLVSEFIGMELPKSSQKSDWSKRPLSEKQIEYAIKDTCYLEQIADILKGRLASLNREQWLTDCVQEMLERSCLNEEEDSAPDLLRQWRIKGIKNLSRRQLEYVRCLWYWRDELARKLDRPAFKVMSNGTIVEIAIWCSINKGKCITNSRRVRLPSNITGKRLDDLIAAITAASETPDNKLPVINLPNDTSGYDEDYVYVSVEPYQNAAQQVANRLGIESPLLVTRNQWYGIINGLPGDIDQLLRNLGILPWKLEYIKEMLEIVAAKK